MDYVDLIAKNRETGPEHAALTPVFYEAGPRRRLTASRKRAKLLQSASNSKGQVSKDGKPSRRKTSPMASKKQKAAARRNIKKAQAALRAKKAGRKAAARKAARTRAHSSTKTPRRAARKAARKSARKAPKRHARKAPKRSKARKSSRKAKRRTRKTRRSMSMRVPRKTKKVYVVAAEKPRKRRRGRRRAHRAAETHHKSRRHHSRGRRRGAMENPMTGVEIFVGSITGLAGFGLADFVDRVLATHALTDKSTKDANGYELYADNPPADGDYVGLFNATAICSPMDWKRWVFGLLGAAAPLGLAQLVSAPTARSALQFFGFGYGVRVVGKGVIDGVAALARHTGFGQRLYDGEMRAAVLKANNGNNQANDLASLPSAGLGAPKQLAGAPCKDCGDKTGAGYPSMPRETIDGKSTQNPSGNGGMTNPTPPAPATPPPAFSPGPLTGVPKNGAPVAVKKNPYAWGAPD
jgi:hypothetical protein